MTQSPALESISDDFAIAHVTLALEEYGIDFKSLPKKTRREYIKHFKRGYIDGWFMRAQQRASNAY